MAALTMAWLLMTGLWVVSTVGSVRYINIEHYTIISANAFLLSLNLYTGFFFIFFLYCSFGP